MGRLRLVPPACAFVLGIASELQSVAIPALLALAVFALCARRLTAPSRINVLGATAFGILDALAFAPTATMTADTHMQRFAATVLEVTKTSTDRSETVVLLPDGSHALASLPGAPRIVGERLLLRGEREAFDEVRNPGETAQREIEAERGISCRLVHARILRQREPDPADVTLWIPRTHGWASARLHAMLAEPGATILAGAMWGERGALPPDLRDEFQNTGTVHVLVTAGLHLGVVAVLALGVLRLLRCGRVSSSLIAIAIVWLYAAFSGAHLPSLRAATMLSFALLARAAGREALSWNALAAAAIVVAAVRPSSVLSASFGLSFSCVAAIFAFAKPFAQGLEERRIPRPVSEALSVTLATQLGTWPLTAAAFLVIAPYAPLANAVVVPVVGVAMLAGFAMLLAAPIPALAVLAANLETSLLDWIVAAVRVVGGLPGAHVIATPPPSWTIAVYDLSLAAAAYAVQRGRVRLSVSIVAMACALCLWPPRTATRDVVITAIDVGQADALLVQTPGGHAYLIDAGGRLERGGRSGDTGSAEDVGTRIVVPFLIRQGIHHLEAVLLSHPHGDHAGGMAPVLRTLGANGFADSGQSYPGHAYHDALVVVHEQHVALLEPRGGDVWRTDDGVTFRFYGPSLPYITGSRSDINSNSLVFRLEYKSFRMLFTGDAGTETEHRLATEHVDVRADVLKVGHHGSAYASTPAFIAAVHPSAAIISVGRHNLFGHPAPSTLTTLASVGSRIFRTDECGAIQIDSDGQTYRTSTTFGC